MDVVVGEAPSFGGDVAVGFICVSAETSIPFLRDDFDSGGRRVGSPGGIKSGLLDGCSGAEYPLGGVVLVPVVGARCTADVGMDGWVDSDIRHGGWR